MNERKPPTAAAMARWLHTYLSLLAFGALLFFGVTGLTLNHATHFEAGGERTREWNGVIPREQLPQAERVEARPLVEWLRHSAGLQGDLHDFQVDTTEITLVLKGPGYSADARIDPSSGAVEVLETRLNAWAWLDDLHKGRDSGAGWSVLIDVAAVLTVLLSLTGLWLLFYVRRRRWSGLVVALLGIVLLGWLAWLLPP